MKTAYLFPYRYKWVSGIVFVISVISLLLLLFADILCDDNLKIKIINFFGYYRGGIIKPNPFYDLFLDEIFVSLAIISGLIYGFSAEKNEDEMVAAIRFKSLAIAMGINYLALFVSYLLVYGMSVYIVLYFTTFSPLLFYIIIFRINMFRFNTLASHEE
ncbi:hypothetical protein ACLI1A_02715 [Flavobacterium sp. RHBU_3]|uniref:hypothetical protein n=1 Tax=Flavobacterium sp. RHBU_3 TaxID=3391184 RepID=UPI003984B150